MRPSMSSRRLLLRWKRIPKLGKSLDAQSATTSLNLGYSLQYTEKAVDSARAARKKRWICFMLAVIILAIIAIVVAVAIVKAVKKN